MALNEDQLTLQKWVHGFAEDVVRPAAEEWDEKEEFPYPIVEQAREIGLYGWEFMAEAMFNDPTGLSMPIAIEELFWGDAGIGMAIMGSGLAAAGIASSATPEQLMEWVPQCYTNADTASSPSARSPRREPDAGSDVGGYRTSAVYDEKTDEWVLNGTKAWITNGGIADIHVVVAVVDPELGLEGSRQLRRPARHEGPVARGRSTRSTASVRATPPRSCSTTFGSPDAACSVARRSSTSGSPACAARREGQRPGRDADVRGDPPRRRRPGARCGPCRLRVLARVREGARGVRPQDHHEPVDRLHARRHGDRDRGLSRPDLRGGLARQERQVRERRRLDGQAQGRPHGHAG